MFSAMVMLEKTGNNSSDTDSAENQHQKGVKHMYENGIDHVPRKYILPAGERPNLSESSGGTTETSLQLPVIDFADLQGPDSRPQVLKSLVSACENYGFFQVVNHGMPIEVIDNMLNVSKRFFEMPMAEREKYMSADMNSLVRYGTSFNQTNDGVFCWRDFLKLVCNPLSDVLIHWPSSPADFRELAATYAKETKSLFLNLAEAIVESLVFKNNEKRGEIANIDVEILKKLENGSQLMVVNCYPPCPEPELTMGMPPHSDYGFLTLLLQDDVKGLQIQHQDNWVTIRPVPGSFVVNVGDHLEIFSNGRYKSVLHRVFVNSMRYRISVASLHSFPFISTIRPSSKLITETNPRRYKDTDFASFLNYITSCDSKKKSFLESRKLICN